MRAAAFRFLERAILEHGDALSRTTLAEGFEFQGRRVPLVGPQGIFKPALLPELPLSITSVAPRRDGTRPYDDGIRPDGYVMYRYRGTDPQHHENVGLRKAMLRRTPLIYFQGIEPGLYLPSFPAFVVEDMPAQLSFLIDVDSITRSIGSASLIADEDLRRRYSTVTTRARLHQTTFRERVLRAYRERCALCRLRHRELLDAAHIVPDADPLGEPLVSNGLALCKLHHAAFDGNLIGIRPDLVVELRRDVLEEEDGPVLQHGLQGFEGAKIVVPSASSLRPNPELLELRYQRFRRAS